MPLPLTADPSERLQELSQNLIAVHVTDSLPRNNKQLAGSCTREYLMDTFQTKLLPPFRQTIHWCLGSTVPEHEEATETAKELGMNNYSQRKYALVTRLRNLEPQLVNIFAYDTIILGDYHLSSEDWVLVPTGTAFAGTPKFQIDCYDPEQVSLKEAVQSLILNQLKGWLIVHKGDGSHEDKSYIKDSEIEINNAIFQRLPLRICKIKSQRPR